MQLRRSIWTRLGIVGAAGSRTNRVVDRAQGQVFRLLWLFLPEPSIANDLRFQHLLLSRFLSEAGQQTLVFGALVAVARRGGSALDMALIGIAALLPPALFGLYGGVVADQLPKRLALAGAYTGQALLCFAAATFFDTGDLAVMCALLVSVNTLGQVSGPTESSVLPLVANEEQLASAASLINMSAAIGAGFATALFAPVLVKAFGVDPALYLAGGLLLFSASRVFNLPVGDQSWRLRFPPLRVRLRSAVRWLVTNPAVGTMIVVSVLAGTVNVVLTTLAPRYVQAVLQAAATDTAYVFAPSTLGVALALLSAPFLIRRLGERLVALTALLLAAMALFLLGIVDQVGSIVDPVNPLHLASSFGLAMNERVRTAGLLAAPLAFGVSLTATSVQTYGGDLSNKDPKLGPLVNNGGTTQTRLPAADSPVKDAASSDCPPPAGDQRGVDRPQGSACDIGAVEIEAGRILVWGDWNCDHAINGSDALLDFLFAANLAPPAAAQCPAVGDSINPMGISPKVWGNGNCDDIPGQDDGLQVLRYFAQLHVLPPTGDCPALGATVQLPS